MPIILALVLALALPGTPEGEWQTRTALWQGASAHIGTTKAEANRVFEATDSYLLYLRLVEATGEPECVTDVTEHKADVVAVLNDVLDYRYTKYQVARQRREAIRSIRTANASLARLTEGCA